MKHTPGPWTYTGNGFILSESKTVVAEVEHDVKLSLNESTANYKLMAASPIMLESLITAKEYMLKAGLTYDNAEVYIQINKAIKKATE